MRRSLSVFTIIAGMSACAGALAAGALPDGPYLIASGTATTDVAPDYAVVGFTIDASGHTTSAASAAVDAKVDKVFKTLKTIGIAEEDIRASTLNVSPDYEYDGNKRNYRGQEVSRNFKVTLHDLSKFSSLIQGLIDDQVDEMGEVSFGSSHEADIQKTNLADAIDDARKQAADMASRAGEQVDRIYGMAPGQYSSFITQQFPYEGYYSTAQLGKIEVTGSRIRRSEGYIIPKSITFSSTVTIVCTVK